MLKDVVADGNGSLFGALTWAWRLLAESRKSSLKHKPALLKAALAMASLATIASMGGGFVLGIALLPFHWMAARSASSWGRLLWAGLAAALVAENVWAGYFVLFGETEPLIWLVPAFSFVLTAIAVFKLPSKAAASLAA